MATIELARLSDHLEEAQVAAITSTIAEETHEDLDLSSNDDNQIIGGNIDDDIFVDFRDRLEANDLDADVYLPVEFEDVYKISGMRIGSTYALQLVLESLREDFFVEDATESEIEISDVEEDFEREIDEADEPDSLFADEEGGIEMKDEQLRHVWRTIYKATQESLTSNLPVFLLD